MRFPVKDSLTEEEIQYGLRSVIKDGLTTQMMVTLTGGIFLVAFALKLGASNLMIGLLAAIPPLAQLVQIPAIYLIEKYRIRRAITVYATASSRIFWLVIALIPFLFSIEAGLVFLIVALFLYAAFGAVGGSSWNSWMHDLVPQDRLVADFFAGRKLAWTLTYTSPTGELVIPTLHFQQWDFFFFLAFLIGIYSIHRLAMVKEVGEVEEKIVVYELISEVKRPLRTFSTAGGLRHMVQFPFAIIRTTFEKVRVRNNRRNRQWKQ
jgi:hypothetical protein